MKYMIGFILLCAILGGCSPAKQESAPLKLVSSVKIDLRSSQEQLQKIYTQADKIDVILHYLHKLTPRETPDSDPEQLLGEQCKVTVQLTDGKTHIYRIQDKQYLSVDLKPWKTVSRERCSVLYHLIYRLEGDSVKSV